MQQTNRKEFVKQLALAGYVLFTPRLANALVLRGDSRKIGLIVNIIENELKRDWRQTLAEVAKIGYDYIEFNTIADASSAEVKIYLEHIGIKPLAGGATLHSFKTPDLFKKMADDALFIGKKYLVCYWPWMDNGDNKTLDDFKRLGEDLNIAGDKCNEQGLRFAFHNHNKEFIAVDGFKWGYDVIVKETLKEKVTLLLDVYWAVKGGADVTDLLKSYPGRFDMLHLKDMDNTPQTGITCPGYGILDFKAILHQAKTAGVKYFTVEVDRFDKPMQCVRDSYHYLKSITT